MTDTKSHIHDQILKTACELSDTLRYSILMIGLLDKDVDFVKEVIEQIKKESSQLADRLNEIIELQEKNLDKKL